MVRKKNVLDVAVQSFAICCLSTVLWFVIGYSLAFTDGGALQTYIGGFDRLFLAGMGLDSVNALAATIPESVFMTFQMTFAIITPALITGAFVDRMKFSAVLWFMALWSLIVYAPIAHWVWGGGFLGGLGVLDFAGGTVVHINAGIAGLVCCIVVGKRKGYGVDNMAPHNLVLSLIGASLLWVGWFGFNAGSAVSAGDRAGMAMVVTQIATAVAALTWMFLEWILRGKPSVLGIISGAVGGLVAITPASGFVGPTGALFIGLAAGLCCYAGAVWLKHALKYDDSLDVFGVHGIGGIVGAILTGVFAEQAIGGTAGLIEGNPGQVWTQIEGILVTIVWCAVASFVILKIIDVIIGLRVDVEDEVAGLDISLHGETVQ
jgi:Amt family ammonium transporter